MDNERLLRLLVVSVVPLGAVGIVLSLFIGDLVFAGIFAAGIVVGALAYWSLSRFPTVFDSDVGFDLASTETFTGSLLQLVGFAFEFLLVGYLCIQLGVVTRAAFTPIPPTPLLGLLGVLPGVFLGAGVPYLTQRRVVFHRLAQSYIGRTVGLLLTFGTYLLLLVAAPGAAVAYVAAYATSRILALVGGQVWARL